MIVTERDLSLCAYSLYWHQHRDTSKPLNDKVIVGRMNLHSLAAVMQRIVVITLGPITLRVYCAHITVYRVTVIQLMNSHELQMISAKLQLKILFSVTIIIQNVLISE